MKEEKQITAGNKLIAKFMENEPDNHTTFGMVYPVGSGLYKAEALKYHSSWDWLMPVIEKIEIRYP